VYCLRDKILPVGSLIITNMMIYTFPVNINSCTYGLVLEHKRPAIIDVIWLFPKGEYKRIILRPEDLGINMSGWTDSISLISLPEGTKEGKRYP